MDNIYITIQKTVNQIDIKQRLYKISTNKNAWFCKLMGGVNSAAPLQVGIQNFIQTHKHGVYETVAIHICVWESQRYIYIYIYIYVNTKLQPWNCDTQV